MICTKRRPFQPVLFEICKLVLVLCLVPLVPRTSPQSFVTPTLFVSIASFLVVRVECLHVLRTPL